MTIFKNIANRFRTNWVGYVSRYKVFLILTIIVCLADMLSTIYFMHHRGVNAEAHPGVRTISQLLGPVLGPMAGKFFQFMAIVGVTVYFRKQAIYLFIAVIILYGWAAWFNIWGVEFYYPNIFRFLGN